MMCVGGLASDLWMHIRLYVTSVRQDRHRHRCQQSWLQLVLGKQQGVSVWHLLMCRPSCLFSTLPPLSPLHTHPFTDLDFLVALQAFLTVVGNCTCWFAAWRIYTAAQAEQQA